MKKILVIQNKRIGDVLLASLIANNIKKKLPNSQIDYLVYDYTAGVIQNNPNVTNIIEVNETHLKTFSGLINMIKHIKKANYDIIFDPYGKFQSRLLCLLSGAKIRVGELKKGKKPLLPFYTNHVPYNKKKTKNCGKAIEDRIKLVKNVFDFSDSEISYKPKIYLTKEESQYNLQNLNQLPTIMLGVFGSTPQKSMPNEYVVALIDNITSNYKANVLFNYAPHQKENALSIYKQCKNKKQIIIDIYEDSIRGFIKLMNKCDLLVGNEGGIVHIAKALNKPTYTIFSPYVMKDHWASFEDGTFHTSIHLLEEQPNLFNNMTVEERRKIESNPNNLYKKLTPELIIPKLDIFLTYHLKNELQL